MQDIVTCTLPFIPTNLPYVQEALIYELGNWHMVNMSLTQSHKLESDVVEGWAKVI